jgi:tetratricopeptide (TPR) repeat protein
MFYLYLILIGSIYLGNILITILHEIGHAIPIALFTKDEVDVYLGSHGQKEIKNLKFRIWRLNFYVYYKFWAWRGGLCIPKSKILPIKQQLIYILIGPIAPTVFFIIATVLIEYYTSNFYISTVIYVMLFYSLFRTIYNLKPSKKTVAIYNGQSINNDGYTIRRLFKLRSFSLEYTNANDAYNNKNYKEASHLYQDLLSKGVNDEQIYKLAISSCIMAGDFTPVKEVFATYTKLYSPQADDLINIGYYYLRMDDEQLALEYFQKSLELSESWHALNNIGYVLNLKGAYSEAIDYFDRAILIDSHAYTYNNRGLARIKLGDIIGGLKDLKQGLTLDPNNSYYYKNMGIYHSGRNEYQIALEFFEKAKGMDLTTYKIDEDIETAKIKLQTINSIV